ncbi:transposase zinc-binding domain-containing protein, partial [Photobacterium phosphoreum]|uniref:transposase zinc-binding domain-containing protein n=1 Tax=Photobacterium phosphoreum TaxID=659 RepID=UPI00192E49F2
MYNPNSINALFTLDKCFHNALKNGHVFRTAELEAVVKVLSCKTHKLCTSCGQKATEHWIAVINSILPDCKYRHITFTMPKAFWLIFQYNRVLLNHLFSL